MQLVALQVEQCNLSRWRDVKALNWLIAHGIGQGIGHAKRRNKVMDSAVLRQSSAHDRLRSSGLVNRQASVILYRVDIGQEHSL